MATEEQRTRQLRLTQNQSLYRQVNERVEAVNRAFSFVTGLSQFVCECANDACTRQVSMTIDEYEAVRARPDTFVVLPDDAHVYLDIEEIVERDDRYWVVQKQGFGRAEAQRLDPRA